jgi:hypothetical protein
MIMNGDEMWIFVTDPLGEVHRIHFPESLQDISEEAFGQVVLPVLEAKTSLTSFMSTPAYLAITEEPDESADNKEPESVGEIKWRYRMMRHSSDIFK